MIKEQKCTFAAEYKKVFLLKNELSSVSNQNNSLLMKKKEKKITTSALISLDY
jgi:hypothetical protein